jgi:hypothetical protein
MGRFRPHSLGRLLEGGGFRPDRVLLSNPPGRFHLPGRQRFPRPEKAAVFLDNVANLLFLREKGVNNDYGTSRWV